MIVSWIVVASRHQVSQDGALCDQVLQAGAEIDELRGHVLAGDGLRLHDADPAEREHRFVEPLRRDAERELASALALDLRGEHEPAVVLRHPRHGREPVGEAILRDADRHRTVPDDLRDVATGVRTVRARFARAAARGGVPSARGPTGRPGRARTSRAHRRASALVRRRPQPAVRRDQADDARNDEEADQSGGDRSEAGPPRAAGSGRRLLPPPLARRGLPQVRLQEREVFDLRLHERSTSAAGRSPRSCSTIASRRRPRLTRWRAFSSVHASRLATSGYARPPITWSFSASR